MPPGNNPPFITIVGAMLNTTTGDGGTSVKAEFDVKVCILGILKHKIAP